MIGFDIFQTFKSMSLDKDLRIPFAIIEFWVRLSIFFLFDHSVDVFNATIASVPFSLGEAAHVIIVLLC